MQQHTKLLNLTTWFPTVSHNRSMVLINPLNLRGQYRHNACSMLLSRVTCKGLNVWGGFDYSVVATEHLHTSMLDRNTSNGRVWPDLAFYVTFHH